ncbi:MAG: cytochrome P450, partial [bacterium]
MLLGNDEGPSITAPGELNSLFEPLLGPQSVLGLSGEPHRRMRQLLMPPFHGERMRSYGEVIQAICREEADGWTAEAPIDARSSMQRITMRTILRTVFGLREGPRLGQLEALLVEMLDGFNQPWMTLPLYFEVLRSDLGPASPWGRFLRKREVIDALLFEE